MLIKSMRYAPVIVLLLAFAGCSSDKPKATAADAGGDTTTKPGETPGGQADAGNLLKDAGPAKRDSGVSKLERPDTLPRPPSGGLPAELRPPR